MKLVLVFELACCFLVSSAGGQTTTKSHATDFYKPGKDQPQQTCEIPLDHDADRRSITQASRMRSYMDCVRSRPGTEDVAEAERNVKRQTIYEDTLKLAGLRYRLDDPRRQQFVRERMEQFEKYGN